MRVPRIFVPQPLHNGDRVQLDENAARHVLQVLRLSDGSRVILFDGSGREFAAELTVQGKHECRAQIVETLRTEQPPTLRIHLALGISRGERMDFAIQKAVELGVWSIAPLFTERTVVHLKGDRLAARQAHWQGVVRHACEQCGRSLLPELLPPQPLAAWLETFDGQGVLLDHRARQGLGQLPSPAGEVHLLIGPEGGLSPAERETAMQKGLQGIRLGPRILRTETAPLAAIAAIQTLWGDFDQA
jgi:16S rRNA (uracil1498-N3)-methyltransferase